MPNHTHTERRARALSWRLAAICAVHGATALAHQGPGADGCATTLDGLRFEITAWQPARSDGATLCANLPATGPTVLVFDAVDAELAELPVELGVWREDESVPYAATLWQDEAAAASRIAHLPAAIRPAGSVLLRHDFSERGRYVVALRATRADGTALYGEFRVAVGTAAREAWRAAAIALSLPLVVAGMFFIDARRLHPPAHAHGEQT